MVTRPDRATALRLARAAEEMAAQWPAHTYYEAARLHLTVFGLGEPSAYEPHLPALVQALRGAARRLPELRVELAGLDVLGDAVVAPAVDGSPLLGPYVAECCARIRRLGPSPTPGLHAQAWWITLARLAAPVEPDLLAFVHARRHRHLGALRIARIELVETDKLFSPQRTRVLARIALARTFGARPQGVGA